MSEPVLDIRRIYYTIESEGIHAGKRSVFFESPACYVSDFCNLCKAYKEDFATFIHTNSRKRMLTCEEIKSIMVQFGCANIVFGCGEVLVEEASESIIPDLVNSFHNVTIETSGTFLKKIKNINKKIRHPGLLTYHVIMNRHVNIEKASKCLGHNDQIKVIIQDLFDLKTLEKVCAALGNAEIFAVPLPEKITGFKEKIVFDYVLKNYLPCRVLIPQHMYIEDVE